MLEKAEISSRVRKGIQPQTVTLNLSEPKKNRHAARKLGAELLELVTEMRKAASRCGKEL